MHFIEIELDNRKRLPLAKVMKGDYKKFTLQQLPYGELLLTPVEE